MQRPRCKAKTKSGEACRSFSIDGRGYCFAHDPARASQRAVARREGGHSKASTVRASRQWIATGKRFDPHDLPALLLGLADAVVAGEVEPSRALAFATLCKTAVSLSEHIEVLNRLQEIERTLVLLNQTGGHHG